MSPSSTAASAPFAMSNLFFAAKSPLILTLAGGSPNSTGPSTLVSFFPQYSHDASACFAYSMCAVGNSFFTTPNRVDLPPKVA